MHVVCQYLLKYNIKAFLVIRVIIKPDMMTWYVSTSCNKAKALSISDIYFNSLLFILLGVGLLKADLNMHRCHLSLRNLYNAECWASSLSLMPQTCRFTRSAKCCEIYQVFWCCSKNCIWPLNFEHLFQLLVEFYYCGYFYISHHKVFFLIVWIN